MKLTDFQALTFDCYGTLIDWESGIHTALGPLLAKVGREMSRDAALETFAKAESRQQAETPGMLYPELLAAVHASLAAEWGVAATAEENAAFGRSVPDWPAFPDATEALEYLKPHYKLVILSNVDRESFKGSNRRLQVAFDAIYTAQGIGSYKPDPRNFDYLLDHMQRDFGIDKSGILHTAQSLFHDHAPATAAGLATAWIDRRKGQEGFGATMPPPGEVKVDFHFASMTEMADAHRAELAGDGG